jgi:hypothetical protein
MTSLRNFVIDLNNITLRAGLLAISTGLLFVLLASGCGTAESQLPQVELQSTATPTVALTATPLRQAASPSETPSPDAGGTEPPGEYDDSSSYTEANVLRDAVRAQLEVDSFRIDNSYNQTNRNLATGKIVEHPFTATAEILPPDKMHLLMVSDMFEADERIVSEIIMVDGMEYRKEQRKDLSYHWVKSRATGTPFDGFQMAYAFWDHIDQMTYVGSETLDGLETDIFEYVEDQEGFKQTDRVWVSVDDGFLRRVELTINAFDWQDRKAVAAIDTTATFVFYDYNTRIKITAPIQTQ